MVVAEPQHCPVLCINGTAADLSEGKGPECLSLPSFQERMELT